MATSGSVDYKLDAAGIIAAALRKCGAIDVNQSAVTIDNTTGLVALNLLIKHLQLEGVGLWLQQEAILHLEYGEDQYNLYASTGDKLAAASDCVKTQLSAAAAAAATALTVDSNTGIIASDKVGVQLDSGVLYWSTQNGAPAGTTDLTLAAGITTAAAADNYVFAFTTILTAPMEILDARLRDVNDADTYVEVYRSIEDFSRDITDPSSTGDPTKICYVPQSAAGVGTGILYTWPCADDVTKRLILNTRRTIEDFDATNNDADFPAPATRAIVQMLAVDLAPEYGREPTTFMVQQARESLEYLKRFYGRKGTVRLMPNF